MFSESQLKGFGPKKRISQETFDAAVHENIEEFEMEPEEALQSAIDEFKAQGVDLSNIILTTSGGDITAHPAAQAVETIYSSHTAGDVDTMLDAIQTIGTLLDPQTASDVQPNTNTAAREQEQDLSHLAAVLLQAEAAIALTKCIAASPGSESFAIKLAALRALTRLLPLGSDHRLAFRRAEGLLALATVIEHSSSHIQSTTTNEPSESHQHVEVVAAAFHAAAAVGGKDEAGKAALMSLELGSHALTLLQTHVATLPKNLHNTHEKEEEAIIIDTHPSKSKSANPVGDLVCGACAMLTVLTTADDESQPASRAFPNARALAKQSAATVLTSALAQYKAMPTAEVVLAMLGALRQVAANEEICKEATDAGAVSYAIAIVRESSADATLPDTTVRQKKESIALIRAALGLLRQLASSDAGKKEIVDSSGLVLVRDTLSFALSAPELEVSSTIPVSIVEHSLGLLTNLMLRNPEAAVVAAETGGLDQVLRAMRAALQLIEHKQQQPRALQALRQGCMALRNAVVRSPELRAGLLEKGAENVIRAAKKVNPEGCGDVGSAALRDLGLDNYNE